VELEKIQNEKSPVVRLGFLLVASERRDDPSSSTRDNRQGQSQEWQPCQVPLASLFPFTKAKKQKGLPDWEGLQFIGGADGTRTRDPRRDRPVF
jgi:hypothetical protein